MGLCIMMILSAAEMASVRLAVGSQLYLLSELSRCDKVVITCLILLSASKTCLYISFVGRRVSARPRLSKRLEIKRASEATERVYELEVRMLSGWAVKSSPQLMGSDVL